MRNYVLTFFILLGFLATAQVSEKAAVQPTSAQQAWMDLGFGMFIHFGINTYYDKEWSDGTLSPKAFNPSELDTDQWCKVASQAGMKYIVIVTKHHDGFCMWPTKFTDYSIAKSPYKKDYLAQVVKSARKYGLKVGFYYSLWDRHEKSHDTYEAQYVEFMKNQIRELLTNYGEICEFWFDGFWKKQKTGWEKPITNETGEKVSGSIATADRDLKFMQAWRNEGAYRWQMDHIYQYIKSLQPNCMVMNNSTTAYPGVPLHPVDVRSGEKYKEYNPNDLKIWNWLGKDMYLPMQIETTMSVRGNAQFPSGNWFWHKGDTSVMSKDLIIKYLDIAKKMNANFLLNVGPMANGKLRPEDVETLTNLTK
ncbi:MAG: alpha-L-fucosidase [Paludibacter sp.]